MLTLNFSLARVHTWFTANRGPICRVDVTFQSRHFPMENMYLHPMIGFAESLIHWWIVQSPPHIAVHFIKNLPSLHKLTDPSSSLFHRLPSFHVLFLWVRASHGCILSSSSGDAPTWRLGEEIYYIVRYTDQPSYATVAIASILNVYTCCLFCLMIGSVNKDLPLQGCFLIVGLLSWLPGESGFL